MAKATTIKEALKNWESKHNDEPATEATDIQLQFQWPPIEKMDANLSTLVNCTKLSLSTNMIDTITGLNGMRNLTILSLARNNIKSLAGIEVVGETLKQLWISYNAIDKFNKVEALKNLEVFYIGNNNFRDFNELNKLNALPMLRDLVFVNNPCVENMDETKYMKDVCRMLKKLKILDGLILLRDEEEEA